MVRAFALHVITNHRLRFRQARQAPALRCHRSLPTHSNTVPDPYDIRRYRICKPRMNWKTDTRIYA